MNANGLFNFGMGMQIKKPAKAVCTAIAGIWLNQKF
jgi:hypothetical protein